MLTSEQIAIVNCPHRHFKVLSAAGSGKTTVLTNRMERLRTEGVDPASMMAITFTRRAGKELRTRLGEEFRGSTIGTFHSAILNVMHESGMTANVLTEAEADELITKCANKLGYRVGGRFSTGSLGSYRQEIREYRNGSQKATPLVKMYLSELAMYGDIDFDGILVAGIKMVDDGKFSWVEHLFVDESQDNEPLQWQFVQKIAQTASVMVVGDVGQSLYEFRGAVPEHFENLDWPTLEMTESFRFPNNIAKVANRTKATPLRVVSKKPDGPVVVRKTEDICSAVKGLLSSGADKSDIAVLCRYNSQVDYVRGELISSGISVVVPKIKSYGQLHYLLMYLSNPNSETARRKVTWIGEQPKIVQFITSSKCTPAAIDGWLDLSGRKVESILGQLKLDQYAQGEADWIMQNYKGRTVGEYKNEESTPEWVADGDGVTVGTVHWSKGGEWPIVIVPHVDEGKWPRKRQTAEERRVFYVAITRAMEELHILHGDKPSQFVEFF
jgi:DNA helicase II / ATP-dependent DNA helicase PcrA